MVILSVKKTKTGLEKMIGLIGTMQPYALLLQTRFGIHTFGLRFPIDILILEKQKGSRDIYYVKTCQSNVKPNRIFLWNPKYQYVLELPEQTIQAKKIKKGEKIKLMIQ